MIYGFAAAVLLLAACGDGSDSADTAPASPTAEAMPARETMGVIAIGHSGMTGENSDPTRPGLPAEANSWATGATPAVDSVYSRFAAARPEAAGHAVNVAEGGATVDMLADQARVALREEPAPALAIVQAIDNDLRCDGGDLNRVQSFGTKFEAALRVISEASPETRILVVSVIGRPAAYARAIEAIPEARATATGDSGCSFFTPEGNLAPDRIATLTTAIEAYEAEQARVCATIRYCADDKGALASFEDDASLLSSDWGHLNAQGQAAVAALAWPAAAALLGLP